MLTSHSKIHSNMAKVMNILENESSMDIDEIIALFKDSENASKELFSYLDSMVEY